MKKYHIVQDIRFSKKHMTLTIDGEKKSFSIKDISSALAHASEVERMTYEISPSGYGIHWPMIDEDISIDGLLGIVHTKDKKRKTANPHHSMLLEIT
jgi:hypothetical protein